MRRPGFPARLVLALSVAGVLAIFLLYTSFTGGTPQLRPSQLSHRTGHVQLVGRVLGPVNGNSFGPGKHFFLRDVNGTARVAVVYRGSIPDMFKIGRDVTVSGRVRDGVFVADPGSMITKCPSKYVPAKHST